jgi:hypothetical protein
MPAAYSAGLIDGGAIYGGATQRGSATVLATLRRICTRQRLFVSYSSPDRGIAEEIALALTVDGHEVFFDRRSLHASDNYGERIRQSIARADRFIFLISRRSLSAGSFTITELEMAQARWPSPVGTVLPVQIDDTVAVGDIPVYLRSVHILLPKGNVAAETAATIAGSTRIRPRCWAIAGVVAVTLAGGLGLIWNGYGENSITDIALQPIERVHFRPLHAPPVNTAAANASTDWAGSPLTITLMPISYNHRTDPGRRARVLNEQVGVELGSRRLNFDWTYVVEITPKPCSDWLCVKTNIGPETLEPGHASTPRETMFLAAGAGGVSWNEFFDYVLGAPNPQIKVTLRYTLDLPKGGSSQPMVREKDCFIDVAQARAAFLRLGFKPGGPVRPPFMQSPCLPVPPGS